LRIGGYTFGRIQVAGRTYTSDVIVAGDVVRDGWWRREGHRLAVEDLAEVLAREPEVVVVGTGYYGRMVIPAETAAFLDERRIRLESAPTAEAVAICLPSGLKSIEKIESLCSSGSALEISPFCTSQM